MGHKGMLCKLRPNITATTLVDLSKVCGEKLLVIVEALRAAKGMVSNVMIYKQL